MMERLCDELLQDERTTKLLKYWKYIDFRSEVLSDICTFSDIICYYNIIMIYYFIPCEVIPWPGLLCWRLRGSSRTV